MSSETIAFSHNEREVTHEDHDHHIHRHAAHEDFSYNPDHGEIGHICNAECLHTQEEADRFAEDLLAELGAPRHGELGHVCNANCLHNQEEADKFAQQLLEEELASGLSHNHDHEHGHPSHICTAECQHSQKEADIFAENLLDEDLERADITEEIRDIDTDAASDKRIDHAPTTENFRRQATDADESAPRLPETMVESITKEREVATPNTTSATHDNNARDEEPSFIELTSSIKTSIDTTHPEIPVAAQKPLFQAPKVHEKPHESMLVDQNPSLSSDNSFKPHNEARQKLGSPDVLTPPQDILAPFMNEITKPHPAALEDNMITVDAVEDIVFQKPTNENTEIENETLEELTRLALKHADQKIGQTREEWLPTITQLRVDEPPVFEDATSTPDEPVEVPLSLMPDMDSPAVDEELTLGELPNNRSLEEPRIELLEATNVPELNEAYLNAYLDSDPAAIHTIIIKLTELEKYARGELKDDENSAEQRKNIQILLQELSEQLGVEVQTLMHNLGFADIDNLSSQQAIETISRLQKLLQEQIRSESLISIKPQDDNTNTKDALIRRFGRVAVLLLARRTYLITTYT